MIATAMDAAQALVLLQGHAGLDLESSLATLRDAVHDGEAETGNGYLVVCNDATAADPRFSIRRPGGHWRIPGGGWARPEPPDPTRRADR
jgi:hypothetical protein